METESKENETDKKAPRLRRRAGLKFAPKASSNSAPKIIPKTYWNNMRRARSRAKAEKQETPIQVAFGQVNPSVPRNFPTPRSSSSDVPAAKLPKKHDDPWDYTSTNYPVTLPLRRPYSGDPDLDEDEFGQSSSKAHDGGLTAAEELGLMDRMDEPQLLFFQLPHSLPLRRQTELVAEADTDTNVDVNAMSEGDNRKRRHYPIQGCKLESSLEALWGRYWCTRVVK